MKFIGLVLLPACVQLLLGAAFIFVPPHGGSFVGLGVMLLGLIAIPVTALLNWARSQAQPALAPLDLAARTALTTLVFPALCLALYVFAS
ncbi:MAG: hypothetical protein M0P19_03580 [Nevskia sp.]|jgi:hypothetical protein|nr:hypothetical protein [Nevskia sp.]MCK9383385.1 hypothetical protein [Nevskia sp.]